MGFTSIDDLVSEMTAGKTWRQDWTKQFVVGNVVGTLPTAVAGRWYDLTSYQQNEYAHGNYIFNGHFNGGLAGWTVSGANTTWDAANTAFAKVAGSADTVTQNTDCVNGTSYEVIFTCANMSGGSVTVSLGGTNGTARSTNSTFTETIACGASANAPLVFTFQSATVGRIDNVYVRRLLAFTPYTDAAKGREAGIWHGGDVSADTKHLTTFGAWTTAATGAGAVLYLVDLLGAYPKIATNSASVQTLNNTLTLPRYTDGKGVRAFFTLNTTNGANAQNFAMTYTNQADATGRSLGAAVANTASAGQSHMAHTGVAAGNYGPFLPLAGGDAGVKSVQSAQFSAASASAGFVDLVLCKPIMALPVTTAFIASERDLLTQLPSLPRIYDGAVLGLILQAGGVVVSTNQWQGYAEFAWG